jgi:transposase
MDIDYCKKLIEENNSYTDISKKLNMPLSTVRRKLNKLRLKTKFNPYKRVNLNLNDLKILVEDGNSISEIAYKLKTSKTNTRYWLKKNGLVTFPKYGKYTSAYKPKNSTNYSLSRNRGLDRKKYFISYLGGKCSVCGYDKNVAALAFHHIDPKLKSFALDIRKMSNTKLVFLKVEVDKCKLVCHNCHMEIEYPHLTKTVGTSGLEPETPVL